MKKTYIASPFFNKKEVSFVEKIENELSSVGELFYSPRLDGVLNDMTPQERSKSKRTIYENNIKNIVDCDCIVAVIDGRDQGTIFEIGYAAALNKSIITITSQSFGVNVMLAEATYAHLNSVSEIKNAIDSARLGYPWFIDTRDVH